MRKPDFFIVGGPKCGTTSLYEYLRAHPQVFFPEIKEPAYFGSDLEYRLEVCARDTIQNRENYLALFRDAGAALRVGDATTYYLVSRRAAREIHEFDAAARIIIMLRDPVDAMYSLHGEYVWNCNENILDFREALAAQQDRRRGKRLAPEAHFPQGLQYEEMVRFTEQVERYFEVFGRDEVCVILFDDFASDTAGTFRRVADYLGIDHEFQPDLRRFNAAKPAGMQRFNRWFARRPGLRRWMNRTIGLEANRRARDLLARVVGSGSRTRRLDPALRRELQQRLAPEVSRLGELLGRDLSSWTAPR